MNLGPGNKIWLNIKYIKIKQNQKLESQVFLTFLSIASSKKISLKTQTTKKVKDSSHFPYVIFRARHKQEKPGG